MASRSFKPASYLASAAQRPPFTRSSSNSSVRSEDSRDFKIDEQRKENVSASSPVHHDTTAIKSNYFEDQNKPPTTPGRKQSVPIAIELPGRNPQAVYTPLSARGDLPGGYFPNHDGEITRSYKSHPFNSLHDHKLSNSLLPDSHFNMSAFNTPVHESVPRAPRSMLSPGFPPEVMSMPMGKYHPSNYSSPANSSATTPSASNVPQAFSTAHLQIPSNSGKRPAPPRSMHERRGSDVKRKIQQYQRDMIAQARLKSTDSVPMVLNEPNSPKLAPLGSPGPITPFELEESAGYLVAGSKTLSSSHDGAQQKQAFAMVQNMIRTEQHRASSPRAMV